MSKYGLSENLEKSSKQTKKRSLNVDQFYTNVKDNILHTENQVHISISKVLPNKVIETIDIKYRKICWKSIQYQEKPGTSALKKDCQDRECSSDNQEL
ncbi:hypothetical protein RhiirA4_458048 [Rhizophagus irregularis]|uniref:Uncharacterized protein n=1 Tax=Rhizophagus irregularis TaxID=588596 RepID=A0A2I1GBD8_9GLOM|nr:hypothetical protein RhiirA4_458048 [Rhizophagus irregularis]